VFDCGVPQNVFEFAIWHVDSNIGESVVDILSGILATCCSNGCGIEVASNDLLGSEAIEVLCVEAIAASQFQNSPSEESQASKHAALNPQSVPTRRPTIVKVDMVIEVFRDRWETPLHNHQPLVGEASPRTGHLALDLG